LSRIGEDVGRIFLDMKLEGFIVAGSGSLKDDLVKNGYMDKRISSKILRVFDLACSGKNGLIQAVRETQDIFSSTKMCKDRDVLETLMTCIADDPEKVSIGLEETKTVLETSAGAVETLIISQEYNDQKHDNNDDDSKESILEYLSRLAIDSGASVHVVSSETAETHQFKTGLGGVCAILRYQIELTTADNSQELLGVELSEDDDEYSSSDFY